MKEKVLEERNVEEKGWCSGESMHSPPITNVAQVRFPEPTS